MDQGSPAHISHTPVAPRVAYVQGTPRSLLTATDTLAVLTFGTPANRPADPRHLHIAMPVLGETATLECWRARGPVQHGQSGEVRWAHDADWLFAHIEVDEASHGHDPARAAGAAREAYAALCAFLGSRERTWHVTRLWNYLDAINQGEGDTERYKHFCSGRAEGMGDFFAQAGFPAATAVGLPGHEGRLVVYCLASREPGRRIENPRQLSAWRYPRQYGRTPPSFARAMTLPAGDALAISGTAAITGHQSRHEDDLLAQLDELKANLDSLLVTAGLPPCFDRHAPLKVYLRHPEDADQVAQYLRRYMPDAPSLLLHGDICRRELLVEIDGWRYA